MADQNPQETVQIGDLKDQEVQQLTEEEAASVQGGLNFSRPGDLKINPTLDSEFKVNQSLDQQSIKF